VRGYKRYLALRVERASASDAGAVVGTKECLRRFRVERAEFLHRRLRRRGTQKVVPSPLPHRPGEAWFFNDRGASWYKKSASPLRIRASELLPRGASATKKSCLALRIERASSSRRGASWVQERVISPLASSERVLTTAGGREYRKSISPLRRRARRVSSRTRCVSWYKRVILAAPRRRASAFHDAERVVQKSISPLRRRCERVFHDAERSLVQKSISPLRIERAKVLNTRGPERRVQKRCLAAPHRARRRFFTTRSVRGTRVTSPLRIERASFLHDAERRMVQITRSPPKRVRFADETAFNFA